MNTMSRAEQQIKYFEDFNKKGLLNTNSNRYHHLSIENMISQIFIDLMEQYPFVGKMKTCKEALSLCNLNYQDAKGRTPVNMVVSFNKSHKLNLSHDEIIDYIHQSDLLLYDKKSADIAQLVVQSNDIEELHITPSEFMEIAKKSNLNLLDSEGKSLIYKILQNKKFFLPQADMSYLIEQSVLEHENKERNYSLIMGVVTAKRDQVTFGEETYSLIDLLLEKGVDINYVSKYNATALALACMDNPEVIRKLIQNGANPELVNKLDFRITPEVRHHLEQCVAEHEASNIKLEISNTKKPILKML